MKSGLRFRLFESRLAVVALAIFGSVSSGSLLFGQALTPDQIEKILQELKQISTQVDGNRLTSRTSAVAAFQKAVTSDKATLELYMACYKEVRFDRQDARSSDFRGWKERNEDLGRDPGSMAALRLQLQYLILTLRAAENIPLKTLVPELEAFAANVVANAELLRGSGSAPASSSSRNQSRGQGHGGNGGGGGGGGGGKTEDGWKRLRESVTNTVFAEAYGLDKTLKVANWSLTPGNIVSIYEKTVFPYYQHADVAQLAAAWDRRIKLEADLMGATLADNPTGLEVFKNEGLPELQFAKARDVFKYASQQQGALAILNLLKACSSHPKASDWVLEFTGLLKEAATPAPSTGAPTTPSP